MLHWLRRRTKDEEPSPDVAEAQEALETSKELVRSTKSGTGEILRVTDHLKAVSAENNFAATLRRAMGGTG